MKLLNDMPEGFVLFRLPRPNRWDDSCDHAWVAALVEDLSADNSNDYLCASEDFIDTRFSISSCAETPAKAIAELRENLNKPWKFVRSLPEEERRKRFDDLVESKRTDEP